MTDEAAVERFVQALLAPLTDVGTMLAKTLDDTNARLDNVVERIDELEGRLIAQAEGRRP